MFHIKEERDRITKCNTYQILDWILYWGELIQRALKDQLTKMEYG